VARASQLEADHEAHVATALTDDRARIARELHDIVAHCVSVMVVQAGAAEELLEREPGRARDSVRAVQDTGRQAIAELGRMLGVLRQPTLDGEKQWGELAPQPGAADLWELSERMSRSGLPVQLVVSGERRALPPGIDLTTYRIVQEALTNALKHGGPGAKAHVELRYTSTTLDLEIRNDGTTPPPVGTGQGLIGMAERVAVYGGVVETGSRPEGGFGVHVVLPLGTP
jgi:signal transduction histidine kinase